MSSSFNSQIFKVSLCVLARCYVSFRKGRTGGWAWSHDKCETDGWWQMSSIGSVTNLLMTKFPVTSSNQFYRSENTPMQVDNITTNSNILESQEAHLSCDTMWHGPTSSRKHARWCWILNFWIAKFCTVLSCKIPFARTWFLAMLVLAPGKC